MSQEEWPCILPINPRKSRPVPLPHRGLNSPTGDAAPSCRPCRRWARPPSPTRVLGSADRRAPCPPAGTTCFTRISPPPKEAPPLTVKTTGIVLGQTPLSSRDRKLTLLTSDLGLIDVIAKGQKGGKNRYAAATEVLAYSEFCLFRGKTFYIVDAADLENNFFGLRQDLTALSLAGYFCELCRFVLPTAENGGDCLRLLLNTLYLLEQKKRSPAFLKAVFELRLLTLCGFAPDTGFCAFCGEEEGDGWYFLPAEGQLCCARCGTTLDGETLKMPLSPSIRTAITHITTVPDRRVFSFRLSPQGEAQLGLAAEAFALYHLGGRFPALDFYKTMAEPPAPLPNLRKVPTNDTSQICQNPGTGQDPAPAG